MAGNFTPIGVTATVKGLNVFTAKMGKMKLSVGKLSGSFTKFAGITAVAVTAALAAIGKASLDSAIEFEDSFAGVRKTVDTTEEEFEKLAKSMRELSTIVPIDVNELNKIAELGGQLGVVDENTKDVTGTLTEFTRVIAALGVSTNLTQEAAATQLARFANIMQTEGEFGQETFSRLGSSIVQLGNNMATTESDILNFGLRIAGAGEIAGLTEAQVFGIGAAMSSVGVQANAGGTAVQKTLIKMNEAVTLGSDDLEVFAATAGKSSEEFATLWEKDAGKAFQEFVNGLGAAGDDAILVLDTLGLKDQRLVRAFLSLANAGGVLDEAMTHANDGFEQNIALAEEAEKKYATTKSQLQIMGNTLKDIGIEIGLALLPVFNDLLIAVKPFITEFGGWIADVFPAMIQNVSSIFTGILLPAFQGVGGWIQAALIPIFAQVWQWLQTNIPLAVQTMTEFWNTTLLPALQETGTWINETLIPVFNTIAGWLQQLLPIAIAELTTWWEAVLLPALAALSEEWKQNIEPALVELWAWLQERVPQAIETLSGFWENVLKPTLETLGVFISETLIPIFSQIVVWLIKNIPVAIDAAVKYWVEVLQPALEQVWKFIQDNVIPIFETVVLWLQENIPVAIAILVKFWEEDLLPALEATWAFIEEYLLPLFEALGEFISASLTWWVQSLAITWEESLLPALKEIWKFIKENLFPLFEAFGKWLNENLLKAIDKIKEGISSLTGKFKEWADQIKNFDPKNLNPFVKESPVPLAEGMKEVGRVMQQLTRTMLPQFNSELAVSAALASAPVSAMPTMADRNVTINMGGNNIASEIDAAAFESNVLRIVMNNIG